MSKSKVSFGISSIYISYISSVDQFKINAFEKDQYFTSWIRKSSSFIPISKYFSVKCLKS